MKVPWPSASLESLPAILWSLARGYRLAYRWRANEGRKDERILSYTESWNAIACRKLNIDFPSAGSQGLRPLGLWIGLHLKSWNNSRSMSRDNLTQSCCSLPHNCFENLKAADVTSKVSSFGFSKTTVFFLKSI